MQIYNIYDLETSFILIWHHYIETPVAVVASVDAVVAGQVAGPE